MANDELTSAYNFHKFDLHLHGQGEGSKVLKFSNRNKLLLKKNSVHWTATHGKQKTFRCKKTSALLQRHSSNYQCSFVLPDRNNKLASQLQLSMPVRWFFSDWNSFEGSLPLNFKYFANQQTILFAIDREDLLVLLRQQVHRFLRNGHFHPAETFRYGQFISRCPS